MGKPIKNEDHYQTNRYVACGRAHGKAEKPIPKHLYTPTAQPNGAKHGEAEEDRCRDFCEWLIAPNDEV